MSKLCRSLYWKSALSTLVIVTGMGAQAQVLRERDLGTSSLEGFGSSCANTGDVDGDGIDDFIVGVPSYDVGSNTDAGRVVIYSGATGARIRSHDGTTKWAEFGYDVAAAGDVDGDGRSDYIVGEPFASGSHLQGGRVVVYSGKSGAIIWNWDGPRDTGYFGHSVDGIGDVNGDGKSDVIVGSLINEVYVLGSNGSTIYQLTQSEGLFGFTVSGCGDLNGDGVNDFLVGKPYAYVATFYDLGLVAAYSGATSDWLHVIWGSNVGDLLGASLAPLGDVNNDGGVDYLAGSYGSDANGVDSGIVRVVSGGGGFIREQTGDAAGDRYGYSLCGIGDVNRDGAPDYAVGATDAGSGHEGRVRLCSGRDGTTIYEWNGVAGVNGDLGSSLASGDWNGDGVDDLVIGDSMLIGPTTGIEAGAVDVELMCPAWWQNYGAGWAGKNGIPSLTSQQNPVVGSPIDVVLGNSLGAATTALLIVGTQWTSVPTSRDGTLLVIPQLTVVLPVPANGLTLSDTLPNDPLLYFLDIYLQALEVDAFATKGLSFTPGLQLHCGFDLP